MHLISRGYFHHNVKIHRFLQQTYIIIYKLSYYSGHSSIMDVVTCKLHYME
jgi:hypothetical protein